MRLVVCMLLCACVYVARDACMECACHEHAMVAGKGLAVFRPHALLQCVQQRSRVICAVSAESWNRVHAADNMVCPSVLRMRAECMSG